MTLREVLRPHIEPVAALVYEADSARSMVDTIGKHANWINRQNFGLCLASIQRTSIESYLLSLAKLYEPLNPRYTIRSVPAALLTVEQHLSDLPPVAPDFHARFMRTLNASIGGGLFEDVGPVNSEIVGRLRERLPDSSNLTSSELSNTLDAVKAHRDKRIAHPEDYAPELLPKPTWGETASLLNYAKCFLGIVGAYYMNTFYLVGAGRYRLADDAGRLGLCLDRLLRMAQAGGDRAGGLD